MLLTVEGCYFIFFFNTLNRAVQGKQDAILLILKYSQVYRVQHKEVLQGENQRPLEYPDPKSLTYA